MDQAGIDFCIGWGKALGAATTEEHKNQESDNTGDKGNRTPERRVLEARLLYHPQRRMMQRLSDAGGRKEK